MTIASVGWALLWGMIVGLDLVSILQIMVARPLVAGTIAGLLFGDVTSGAVVGAVLELFALDLLPVGAARYPDYGPAAVAAAATVAGSPGVLGFGPALMVGLTVAYGGELTIQLVRRRNSLDVRRHRIELDAADSAAMEGVHGRGIARDALRALLVTAGGLCLAYAVRRWLPVTVRGAVLSTTVALGAAFAVAATGGDRLAGRGAGRAWLVAGLAAGLCWVAWL